MATWQDKYSGLKWEDLVNQAKGDHAAQWERGIDPLTGGFTTIGGQRAQIRLVPDDSDTGPADWWDKVGFNLADPDYVGVDGTKDWRLAFDQGPNGEAIITPQKTYNNDLAFLGDAAKFIGAAAGMNAGFGALGGTSAAGAGAGAGAEAAGGFSSLPAGGMTATGTTAPWAGAGELGTLGSGTFGATTEGVGSLMGTMGGIGEFGSGLSGVTAASGATGAGMFDGLLNSIPQGVKDFATSKAGSALIGGILGGVNGSGQSGAQTATRREQIDPRMDAALYGNGTNPGVINQITGLLDRPQNPGMAAFGSVADQYLANNGQQDLTNMRATSNELMRSLWQAPQMQSAQIGNVGNMQAAKVNAPGQNDINLSPAYQDLIFGNPAENPYLTGAIQKGINQSNTAFGNMLQDATRNLTQTILPNIRSGAIVNGAMGGSRQGIAEARALEDFSTQMGRAASQFGQNNTDAAVGAQAGAFDAGQGRKLAAVQGLGGQQYSTALTDAGFQQQANQTNYQGNLQKAMQDAQFQQQTNLANQNAQLGTNQLNTQRQLGGLSAGSGLLDQAYGFGTNADSYAGNKVGQVAGLLSPFTGLGATQTNSQPLYSNTGAGVLGGVMGGLGLWNAFNQKQA